MDPHPGEYTHPKHLPNFAGVFSWNRAAGFCSKAVATITATPRQRLTDANFHQVDPPSQLCCICRGSELIVHNPYLFKCMCNDTLSISILSPCFIQFPMIYRHYHAFILSAMHFPENSFQSLCKQVATGLFQTPQRWLIGGHTSIAGHGNLQRLSHHPYRLVQVVIDSPSAPSDWEMRY